MDKKNTMLLTVIAVATLLVAVVGATFAYFTASNTNDKGTTVVTATTESVAAVALTNETNALSVELSATDMAQVESAYRAYWATDSTGLPYEDTATQRNILKAAVQSDTNAKYTCTVTLNVTVDGATLQPGDAYVQFGGQLASAGTEGKVDLASVAADGYDVTFNLDGTNKEQYVTAAVAFENRDANQDHLANKTIKVNLQAADDFKCTVVQ